MTRPASELTSSPTLWAILSVLMLGTSLVFAMLEYRKEGKRRVFAVYPLITIAALASMYGFARIPLVVT